MSREEKNRRSTPGGKRADELLGLLIGGRKIEAVRLYREQTGCSLQEAKEAVEKLERERGLA